MIHMCAADQDKCCIFYGSMITVMVAIRKGLNRWFWHKLPQQEQPWWIKTLHYTVGCVSTMLRSPYTFWTTQQKRVKSFCKWEMKWKPRSYKINSTIKENKKTESLWLNIWTNSGNTSVFTKRKKMKKCVSVVERGHDIKLREILIYREINLPWFSLGTQSMLKPQGSAVAISGCD